MINRGTFSFFSIALVIISFNNQDKFLIVEKCPSANDNDTIHIAATFVKNIRGGYCEYVHMPEVNLFTYVTIEDGMLVKKEIQIDYPSSCTGKRNFIVGKTYMIKAIKVTGNNWSSGYTNVSTTPDPSKLKTFGQPITVGIDLNEKRDTYSIPSSLKN